MPAGAPYGNKNAEKWTLEESIKLFNDAIEHANEIETVILTRGEFKVEIKQYKFDFIGEVAREIGLYKSIFTELVTKFPKELKQLHTQLIETLEANCFCNSKKGAIKEATAIVNLKSNHNWKDRTDFTSNEEKITGINYLIPDEHNNKTDKEAT